MTRTLLVVQIQVSSAVLFVRVTFHLMLQNGNILTWNTSLVSSCHGCRFCLRVAGICALFAAFATRNIGRFAVGLKDLAVRGVEEK